MSGQEISRRRLLRWSAAGVAGAASQPFWPSPAHAADPVAFGVISPTTGTFGYAGEAVGRGAALALAERGEILGHKLTLVTRDDEGTPAAGVRRLSEIASSEHVRFFNGNYASPPGLAEAEVAQKMKLLQVTSGGSEDFNGARCNRHSFHWSIHAFTAARSVVDFALKEKPSRKRWYTITADYTFGQSLLKYMKIAGESQNLEWVGNDFHPLGERQFTQYLAKAIAAKPDVLCLLNGGSDAETCIRQFQGYGAKDIQIVAPWAIESDQLRELTPEISQTLIIGVNYYDSIDTPANKAFVAAYKQKHGTPPNMAAAYGYDSFRTILLAMDKAKSVEVADVIRAMEGMQFDSVFGPTRIDETHQFIRPGYVIRGKAAVQMKNPDDLAEIVYVCNEMQPKALNECKSIGEI